MATKDRTLRIIVGALLILAGLPGLSMFGMMGMMSGGMMGYGGGFGSVLGLIALAVGLWLLIDAAKSK